jgi:hypothetical protein
MLPIGERAEKERILESKEEMLGVGRNSVRTAEWICWRIRMLGHFWTL